MVSWVAGRSFGDEVKIYSFLGFGLPVIVSTSYSFDESTVIDVYWIYANLIRYSTLRFDQILVQESSGEIFHGELSSSHCGT